MSTISHLLRVTDRTKVQIDAFQEEVKTGLCDQAFSQILSRILQDRPGDYKTWTIEDFRRNGKVEPTLIGEWFGLSENEIRVTRQQLMTGSQVFESILDVAAILQPQGLSLIASVEGMWSSVGPHFGYTCPKPVQPDLSLKVHSEIQQRLAWMQLFLALGEDPHSVRDEPIQQLIRGLGGQGITIAYRGTGPHLPPGDLLQYEMRECVILELDTVTNIWTSSEPFPNLTHTKSILLERDIPSLKLISSVTPSFRYFLHNHGSAVVNEESLRLLVWQIVYQMTGQRQRITQLWTDALHTALRWLLVKAEAGQPTTSTTEPHSPHEHPGVCIFYQAEPIVPMLLLALSPDIQSLLASEVDWVEGDFLSTESEAARRHSLMEAIEGSMACMHILYRSQGIPTNTPFTMDLIMGNRDLEVESGLQEHMVCERLNWARGILKLQDLHTTEDHSSGGIWAMADRRRRDMAYGGGRVVTDIGDGQGWHENSHNLELLMIPKLPTLGTHMLIGATAHITRDLLGYLPLFRDRSQLQKFLSNNTIFELFATVIGDRVGQLSPTPSQSEHTLELSRDLASILNSEMLMARNRALTIISKSMTTDQYLTTYPKVSPIRNLPPRIARARHITIVNDLVFLCLAGTTQLLNTGLDKGWEGLLKNEVISITTVNPRPDRPDVLLRWFVNSAVP